MNNDQIRNPYKNDSGELVLRKSVVAYVDILGYLEQVKRAVKAGKKMELLIDLRKAYDETYNHIKDQSHIILPELGTKPHWSVKGFTDNIVIGYPISRDAEPELGTIMSNLAFFQLMMITHGFFVRGGIAIGDLYMDDEIVFGEGLLEAYDVERNLARDPRIVLSESARKYSELHISYYAKPDFAPQTEQILKDKDGQIFINYLYPIVEFAAEYAVYEEELSKHKKIVEAKLKDYSSEPAVWSKYFWVANYHNWFCDQYDYFDESHKIDISDIPIGPSRFK